LKPKKKLFFKNIFKFQKSRNIQKTIENTGGIPVFSEKFDCFLNIFGFLKN